MPNFLLAHSGWDCYMYISIWQGFIMYAWLLKLGYYSILRIWFRRLLLWHDCIFISWLSLPKHVSILVRISHFILGEVSYRFQLFSLVTRISIQTISISFHNWLLILWRNLLCSRLVKVTLICIVFPSWTFHQWLITVMKLVRQSTRDASNSNIDSTAWHVGPCKGFKHSWDKRGRNLVDQVFIVRAIHRWWRPLSIGISDWFIESVEVQLEMAFDQLGLWIWIE